MDKKQEVDQMIVAGNQMTIALEFLLQYPDANVQKSAQTIKEALDRKQRVLGLIQEALSQLRLDVKYLAFDLECTRRERDDAQAKLSNGPFGD